GDAGMGGGGAWAVLNGGSAQPRSDTVAAMTTMRRITPSIGHLLSTRIARSVSGNARESRDFADRHPVQESSKAHATARFPAIAVVFEGRRNGPRLNGPCVDRRGALVRRVKVS